MKWLNYIELCKPRVVALMLVTAVVGMQLASPGWIPWKILLLGTLGIALCAGSAATINHLLDYKIDLLMARTHRRPLPAGHVTPRQALYFAIVLGCAGIIILIAFINLLTAILTFLTLVGYAIFYTLYLKRATPQNIVIGGIAGAAPPLLGWTAVTGHLDPNALLLVLIIFAWTPPHFWALSLYRYKEYAKADIPMLPVTHGIAFTKLNILLYTLLLTAVSLLPYVTGMSGILYLVSVLLLDAGFLFYAIRLWRTTDNKIAVQTFRYSIIYLLILFIVLLIDHFL
jgi:protoheme IX farnesyltransferase